MQIHVSHGLADLQADMVRIIPKAKKDMRDTVRDGVKVGSMLARENARRSSGTHGRLYPRTITASMSRGGGLFGNTYSGEYGPDPSKPQGGMSFEFGSRNQPPHLDLARSADAVGPSLAQSIRDASKDWFW